MITNKFNLPSEIVRAVQNDPYDSGDSDISVTRLINPPQMEALKRQHNGEVVEDASDLIWALIGQSIHSVIERSALPGDDVENRVYANVLGWKVSGQYDKYDNGTVRDYKVTSVWAVKDALENGKSEWTDQLNLLAVLCEANEKPVNGLEILAICRDWSKYGGQRDQNYPPQAVVIPVPLKDDRNDLMERRVALHQAAREGDYPPCTATEMWEKPSTYAVMKEGRKSALRVLDTITEAYDWAQKNRPSGKITLQHRPGERIRCENYCQVKDFCSQYKEYSHDMG